MASGRRKTPSVARHLELAKANQDAFKIMRASKPPVWHWAGTALFYSAVHYTDALLLTRGEPSAANHDERWRQLDRQVDDEYMRHYGALKDLSEDWRYYGVERDGQYLDLARVGHHAPIERAVDSSVPKK